MDKSRISEVVVIVPAYNAEKTIMRTVESLKRQTIPIEIVVVDDGSAVPLSIEGVRVIHQANAGAYTARLNGVAQTSAPFIGFVDADDEIEPDMYEKMLNLAKTYELDVVQCGVFGTLLPGNAEILSCEADVRSRIVTPMLIKGDCSAFVWDKLYRRSVCFGDLSTRPFEKSGIFMFDDLAINLQAFTRVKRVGMLMQGLYHYNVGDGSSVRNFKRKNIEDLKEAIRFRAKFLPYYGVEANDPVYEKWIKKNLRNYLISVASAGHDCMVNRIANAKDLYMVVKGRMPLTLAVQVVVINFLKNVQRRLQRYLSVAQNIFKVYEKFVKKFV